MIHKRSTDSLHNYRFKVNSIHLPSPPSDSSHTTRMELEELETIIQEAKLPRALMRVADRDPLRLFFSLAKKKGIEPHEAEVKELAEQLTNLSFDLKNRYKRRRPWEVKREHDVDFVVDKTDTSDSSSYPSGHALMGYGVAEFYKDKYPLMADEWDNLAAIIAHQRMQSGVHYPSDIKASKKVVEQLYTEGSKTANLSLNSILKATEEGLSKMNLTGLADKVDLFRARRNLGKAVKELNKYQDVTSRFGQMARIPIPKTHLDVKDLKRLGFQDSLIAVPEIGQKTWTTYRHPLDKLHLHDHGDLLNMHIDSLPSLQMIVERNKLSRKAYNKLLETIPEGIKPWKKGRGSGRSLLKKIDDQVSGIGHAILEGGPGYINYGLKQLNPFKVGMTDEILSKLPKDYLKRTYGYTRKVAEATKTAEEQPLLRHRSTLLIRDPETNKLLASKAPEGSEASPFFFPGGGLYDDEYSTPRNPTEEEIIEGARREALEELGMELNNPRVVGSFGQELEGWWKDKALKKRGVPYLGGHEHYILADKGKEDRSLYNIEGDAFEQGDYYDPKEIVEALSRAAKGDSAFAPFNKEQVRAIKENLLSKKAALESQESIFERLKDLVPKGTYHVSGGLPDARGISDVDMFYPTEDHTNLLDRLPKGTTITKSKPDKTIYTIPGYDREVNLFATLDPMKQESILHRATMVALAKQYPELERLAFKEKATGLGSEPAWTKILGVEGDPYERMQHTEEMLEAAKRVMASRKYRLKKNASDLSVLTAVPKQNLDLIMRKGLYSQKAMLDDPEVMAAFLAQRNADKAWKNDEQYDEKRFREQYDKRLKLMEGDDAALSGPSVFFTEPDPDKVSDPRHFINKFDTQKLRVNLAKLLRDIPETRIQGAELIPFPANAMSMSDDEWDEIAKQRRRDLTSEEVEAYTATDPKELWKDYGEDHIGRYYAANVPHAFIRTPSGIIPPEYLERVEKTSEAKPDLNNFIKYIEEEARKRGVKDMHVVMSHPDHPLGGGSAHYTTDLDKDSKSALLVKALRGKMREWEQQQGLDPDHDWSKTSEAKRLYHGSPLDLEELELRVPPHHTGKGEAGEAGVYAADNPIAAALYALARNKSRGSWGVTKDNRLVMKDYKELNPEGYVYELDSKDYSAPPEDHPALGYAVKDPSIISKRKVTEADIADYIDRVASKEEFMKALQQVEKTSSAKEQLKHILVTGHSGAGKTTYARQLAEELGIPLHRLDVPTGPIMEERYPNLWDQGTLGFPEDVTTDVIQQALDLDKPHVIEGSHILEIPELTEGYRRILIDTPEDRVVEQRAQREYRNQGRKGKPYRPIEKHREAAKELVNHYRDIVTNFRNQPGVESIVPVVKTAQEQLKHILITGQSGSGKTTEAKRLAEELSMPVIHLDEQKGFGPKGVDPDYIEDLTEATQDIIRNLGKPHIIEGTQMLSEQFPLDILQSNDLRIMEADEDELVRRLTERGWNTESGRDLKGPESADEARHVTKHQRKSVDKLLGKLKKKASLEDEFQPDLTPDDLKALGVYDQVYGDAPSEASMKEWPEHWINKQDPLGWLQWYERYSKGRRTEDDARQIKRWKSFKARHLAQYLKKPTIKRKAALRNWAIDVDGI